MAVTKWYHRHCTGIYAAGNQVVQLNWWPGVGSLHRLPLYWNYRNCSNYWNCWPGADHPHTWASAGQYTGGLVITDLMLK